MTDIRVTSRGERGERGPRGPEGPTGPAGPGFLFVFQPGGVAGGNVFTDWPTLVAALAAQPGEKILQFDDRIVTPCVVPPGTWDMTEVEWFGDPLPASVAVSVSDGASLPNLRKMGGFITVTNHNNTTAPVVIPNTVATTIFNLGRGLICGDFCQIVQAGSAPFFDCSALLANDQFLLRVNAQVSGTSPFIQFGNSPGKLALALYESRIWAGMIAGTNAAAIMNVAQEWGASTLTRQDAWAGTINRGSPNALYSASAGLGGTPFVRTLPFPAPVNQVAAAPSTAALTQATGLGMNSTLRLDATAGIISQPLPLIRATSPAIGATTVVAGVLDSTGMIIIVREFSGVNGVSLTPAAGNTIEGGAGPLVVPAGGSRILQSDGIADWRVIAGYL